jgi:hypothetical protein
MRRITIVSGLVCGVFLVGVLGFVLGMHQAAQSVAPVAEPVTPVKTSVFIADDSPVQREASDEEVRNMDAALKRVDGLRRGKPILGVNGHPIELTGDEDLAGVHPIARQLWANGMVRKFTDAQVEIAAQQMGLLEEGETLEDLDYDVVEETYYQKKGALQETVLARTDYFRDLHNMKSTFQEEDEEAVALRTEIDAKRLQVAKIVEAKPEYIAQQAAMNDVLAQTK